MSMLDDVREQFKKDVGTHLTTIVRDDGVDRHVRFRRAGTSRYWFDLITWPGRLCIDGDMGTYVFARIEDMFEFFRSGSKEGEGLSINRGYWAEKVLASDKNGNIKEYSREVAEQRICEAVEEYKGDDLAALKNAIDDEVCLDDGEYAAHEALRDFEWNGEPFFYDTWEWDLKEYTYSYVWNCFAIVWGIQQYDEMKRGER